MARFFNIHIEGFEEIGDERVEADGDDEFLKLLVAKLLDQRIEGRVRGAGVLHHVIRKEHDLTLRLVKDPGIRAFMDRLDQLFRHAELPRDRFVLIDLIGRAAQDARSHDGDFTQHGVEIPVNQYLVTKFDEAIDHVARMAEHPKDVELRQLLVNGLGAAGGF